MDLVGNPTEDQRADRDRWDEVAVHYVEVDDPRPGIDHLGYLRSEVAHIGREDRRQDPRLGHQLFHPLTHRPQPTERPRTYLGNTKHRC